MDIGSSVAEHKPWLLVAKCLLPGFALEHWVQNARQWSRQPNSALLALTCSKYCWICSEQ